MAKRRTRKDKVEARHVYSYHLVTEERKPEVETPSTPLFRNTAIPHPLLISERRYILADLVKTTIFSTLMLAAVFAIYYYWPV
jgi:hypothetical protein